MKRDMRTKQQKQHLGTAANRDQYEQKKSVVLQDNRGKPDREKKQEDQHGSNG